MTRLPSEVMEAAEAIVARTLELRTDVDAALDFIVEVLFDLTCNEKEEKLAAILLAFIPHVAKLAPEILCGILTAPLPMRDCVRVESARFDLWRAAKPILQRSESPEEFEKIAAILGGAAERAAWGGHAR